MIAGSAAAYGAAPISRVVPMRDGQLVPGAYPLIVEVGHGTSALRRELVVRVH